MIRHSMLRARRALTEARLKATKACAAHARNWAVFMDSVGDAAKKADKALVKSHQRVLSAGRAVLAAEQRVERLRQRGKGKRR